MSDEEVLTKAIKKAIAGGWTVNDWTDSDDFEWEVESSDYESDYPIMHCTGMGEEWWLGIGNLMLMHDFAKALWGEDTPGYWQSDKPRVGMRTWQDAVPGWQYHLQQMVIADDPIAYLKENI